MSGNKNKLTDTELTDDFIEIIRNHYIMNFTGYDTWIDRGNVTEHLLDIIREANNINGKLSAIALIADGE
jgi:hypothetical protein